MKYADAKRKLSRISKFDDTEIYYDSKSKTFYCYIGQTLHKKAKNIMDSSEVNLFHYIESTRSDSERKSMKSRSY